MAINILLKKLNYKDQNRIVVINAGEILIKNLLKDLPEVQIDTEIDPRYPYEFMLIFVELVREVKLVAPRALHNLKADGTLWFAYPKKTSNKYSSDIDRDHGWEVLLDRGFDKVRLIAIDDDWSALRFRNVRFIKSVQTRFSH
jgi:hypothetical protein